VEQRKVVLEARRATMTPSSPRLHPNPAEVCRREIADPQSALADPAIQSEALQISHGLIERVVLHPMDMGIEIELIVEIAAMVDLGTNNKTAGLKGSAVPDPFRRLLDMVAGARSQFYLLFAVQGLRPMAASDSCPMA
jgi:hypothetical protein